MNAALGGRLQPAPVCTIVHSLCRFPDFATTISSDRTTAFALTTTAGCAERRGRPKQGAAQRMK